MTSDEEAIRAVIATWLQASTAGDTQRVLALMDDDAVFLVAGHPPMRGKAAFAESQRSIAGMSLDASSNVREVKTFGDWGYAWTDLTVVMTPTAGRATTRRGSTLSVFRKASGEWVLYRDANLLAPMDG